VLIDMKRKGLIYCIQEHHSKKLHWDLRLEMNNVLKSWAMPKKPINKSGVKRLLIETEDHTLEFADFEGEIPKDQYGAGIIKIFDKGTYEIQDYKEGEKFVIDIEAKELKGIFIIIKIKKEREWLFFKKS